jgi:protein-S-isoprenylcysteine O-methyltransferase Ste14
MIKSLGLRKFIHDIQHRRDRYRQFIGIAFLLLVTAAGNPKAFLFWPGLLLASAGMAVRLWASGHIKKDKALATDGPYGYVRHPLYVGNILLGIGFSLACGLWWGFPLFVGILAVFYPPAIKSEDEKLRRLFTEEWENWRMHTRALIPHFKTGGNPGGSWSFYQSLRQNGEPVIALLLLACLYYLYLKL